jgi:hypothetical protein
MQVLPGLCFYIDTLLGFLLLSKVPGSDQAESTDWINVLIHQRSSWKMSETLIWNAINTAAIS